MNANDYQELQKLLDLYNETSKTMDNIRARLNGSGLSEQDELALHYNSFKNVKNFLATQANKSVISLCYDGLTEDDMLLPSEISSRDEKHNEWQRHAFDDYIEPATGTGLSKDNSGIDIGVFEHVLDWSKIAAVSTEKIEEKTLKHKEKKIPSVLDKICVDEILEDTKKTTLKPFVEVQNRPTPPEDELTPIFNQIPPEAMNSEPEEEPPEAKVEEQAHETQSA